MSDKKSKSGGLVALALLAGAAPAMAQTTPSQQLPRNVERQIARIAGNDEALEHILRTQALTTTGRADVGFIDQTRTTLCAQENDLSLAAGTGPSPILCDEELASRLTDHLLRNPGKVIPNSLRRELYAHGSIAIYPLFAEQLDELYTQVVCGTRDAASGLVRTDADQALVSSLCSMTPESFADATLAALLSNEVAGIIQIDGGASRQIDRNILLMACTQQAMRDTVAGAFGVRFCDAAQGETLHSLGDAALDIYLRMEIASDARMLKMVDERVAAGGNAPDLLLGLSSITGGDWLTAYDAYTAKRDNPTEAMADAMTVIWEAGGDRASAYRQRFGDRLMAIESVASMSSLNPLQRDLSPQTLDAVIDRSAGFDGFNQSITGLLANLSRPRPAPETNSARRIMPVPE